MKEPPADAWRSFEVVLPKRQLVVLRAMRDGGTHTQASIVQATGLAQPHASRALKELVERGLVAKGDDGWRLTMPWPRLLARVDHEVEARHAEVQEVLEWLAS